MVMISTSKINTGKSSTVTRNTINTMDMETRDTMDTRATMATRDMMVTKNTKDTMDTMNMMSIKGTHKNKPIMRTTSTFTGMNDLYSIV